MSDAVISALITGSLALVGVVITCYVTSQKTRDEIRTEFKVAQAVTDTKIEELTREVREHNNFAKRMPIVENDIKHINEEIVFIEDEINKYHG